MPVLAAGSGNIHSHNKIYIRKRHRSTHSTLLLSYHDSWNQMSPTFKSPRKASLLSIRAQRNPALQAKISQMALPLVPLVRLTTGDIHPYFPTTLLNFWLLTSDQLDELAHFYHQRTPSIWSARYPCPVVWGRGLTLEEKRRKIGRFIGLSGCGSPVKTEDQILVEVRRRRDQQEEEMWNRKLKWY
jgi:hypothetical protein